MKQFCVPSLFLVIVILFICPTWQLENKYSKEANLNYRELKDPFRMSKINMVWHKAIHKLTDTKLKSLYTDLMGQDKDEIKLKRLKADGHDKDGLQEAEIRRRFKDLLSLYGLLEHFVDGTIPVKHQKPQDRNENHINKRIFKDKKLGKLWEKAERSGFDQKELKLLKEEFQHHQDKIDEYYNVLEKTERDDTPANFLEPLDEFEQMDHYDKSKLPSKKYPDGGLDNVNDIRTRHRTIKDGYDVLHQKIASGPDSEFSEPRVANLWKMALNADFNPDELKSLRDELKHYEKRVEKLQHLQSDYLVKKMHADKDNLDKEHLHTDKDYSSHFQDKIKRHERTVEKLHLELETKILNRHNEL